MEKYVEAIFFVDVFALFILLGGILWSVLKPAKRIWPPPSKGTWQHFLTWFLFYLVFGLNFLLLVLDWNSWILNDPLRLIIGIPFIIIGFILLVWGIRSLGVKKHVRSP